MENDKAKIDTIEFDKMISHKVEDKLIKENKRLKYNNNALGCLVISLPLLFMAVFKGDDIKAAFSKEAFVENKDTSDYFHDYFNKKNFMYYKIDENKYFILDFEINNKAKLITVTNIEEKDKSFTTYRLSGSKEELNEAISNIKKNGLLMDEKYGESQHLTQEMKDKRISERMEFIDEVINEWRNSIKSNKYDTNK